MEKPDKTKNSRRLSFQYKYIVLLAAFLGAVVLWFYAIGYDSTEFENTYSNIPVEVRGSAVLKSRNGFTPAEQLVMSVSVTVRGRRSDLNSVDSDDITAYIDISSVEEAGYNHMPIHIITPNGTSVARVSSNEVSLYFDSFVTKQVQVNIELSYSYLASNLKIKNRESNPYTVLVSGPQAVVERVSAVLARVETGEVTQSFYSMSELIPVDENGNKVDNEYLSLEIQEARVYFEVIKEKTLYVSASFIGGIIGEDSDVSILIDHPQIVVSGSISEIDRLDDIVIQIDERLHDITQPFTISTFAANYIPGGITIENGVAVIVTEVTASGFERKQKRVEAKDIEISDVGEDIYTAVNGFVVDFIADSTISDDLPDDLFVVTASADQTYTADGKEYVKCVVSVKDEYKNSLYLPAENEYIAELVKQEQ